MTALRQRQPRQKDGSYLTLIRQCPCISCGIDPAGEAAHVRMTGEGKVNPGLARKPDDEYAIPLCHECHMLQHSMGERIFWNSLGVNPIVTCRQLYRLRGNFTTMHSVAGTIAFTNDRQHMEIPF